MGRVSLSVSVRVRVKVIEDHKRIPSISQHSIMKEPRDRMRLTLRAASVFSARQLTQ